MKSIKSIKHSKRYNGTYTDWGVAYSKRMREIAPQWISHSIYLILGILSSLFGFFAAIKTASSFSLFFLLLGVSLINSAIYGFKQDYKKRHWTILDY